MLQLCRVTKYALFGQQNQQKFQKVYTSLQWLWKDMIHPCKHALCHTKKQNVQRGIPGIVRGMWPKHWLKLEISSKQFLRLQSCIEKAWRKTWKLATWTCWVTAFKIPKLDVLCPVLAVKRCKGSWQKKHWQAIKIVTWKLATFCKTKPNLRGTHTCTLAMTELSASKFGLMSMKVLLRFFQLESIIKNPTSSCYSCVEFYKGCTFWTTKSTKVSKSLYLSPMIIKRHDTSMKISCSPVLKWLLVWWISNFLHPNL